jgi:hypothetical protein
MAGNSINDKAMDFYKTNGYSIVQKTVTFDGAAGTGAAGTVALFTVSGRVMAKIFAFCTVNLASADSNTFEVGTALSTAGLIAQTTSTNIDANEIYHDATPDSSIELSSVSTEKIISQSIIGTVGAGASGITAGTIVFVVHWRPVTEGATVVAA